MQRVTVTTSTQVSYVCDICNQPCEEYQIASPLKAGVITMDSTWQVNYGLQLTLSKTYGSSVQHVCRDCMRKALQLIVDSML